MSIKISADSTCDLSPELLDQYHISLTPLYVIKDGEALLDGVDIHPADIFSHVDAGGKLCSTSAVNVDDYRKLFSELSPEYEAVIHITLGSGFSSCYQNATLAAADYKNVFVVDSRNLSSGQGLLVLEAAQLAEKGMKAMEICSLLRETRAHVETSFLIDRLDYMHKGGRCSSVAALGANLLKIKPCIGVIDGKMTVTDKFRGRLERAIEKYVKERLKDRKDLRTDRIFITHSLIDPEIVAVARETIKKYASFEQIIETDAGCTVSCHCGPGTLGILFITK